jgi:DNA-binding protein YbaB
LEANGLMEVLRCRIDPALLAQQDRELLEDLVASAVNQAVGKAKQLHGEAVRAMAGGLPLPGLEQTLDKLFSPPTGDPPSQS